MKFCIFSILIIMILIGVNSAPKNSKNTNKHFNKKCNQCKVNGHDTLSPVCGRLNDIEETFESRPVFECFAKCRKVEYFEFLNDGECKQTREQCKAKCDETIPWKAPPGCEGHPSGLGKLTTYPFEALLDCYINCPENNLTKIYQGPCIDDRNHPMYGSYAVLAPYHVCFTRNDTTCKTRQLKAMVDNYPVFPSPSRGRFYRYY